MWEAFWGGSTRRFICWWGFLTCPWLVVVSGVDQLLWMGRLPMCLEWSCSLTWAGSGCRRDAYTGRAGERRPLSTADSLAKVELTKWEPGLAFLPPLFLLLLLRLLFLFFLSFTRPYNRDRPGESLQGKSIGINHFAAPTLSFNPHPWLC